jgi:uncharacterized protein YqgC (DUF456 family)
MMIPGVLAMITPMIPGIPYMFLLTVVYGLIDRFQTFEWWYLLIFLGLVIIASFVDYFAGVLGARYGGASKKSAMFGLGGLIIGMIIFPPFGAFLGLFLGVLIGEIVQFGPKMKALKAAGFSLAGAVVGVVVNFLIALGFFITFAILIF